MSNEISWDNFSERTDTRKLGLQVDDQTFWVPRASLAEMSPVFKTMFYGQNYKESKLEIITLPDKEKDGILEMLRCLFRTGTEYKKIDMQNLEILMQLADEYQIDVLTKKCKKFIKKKVPMVDSKGKDIEKLFAIGVRYKMKEVVRLLFSDVRLYFRTSLFFPNRNSARNALLDEMPTEVRNAFLAERPHEENDGSHLFVDTTDRHVECGICVKRNLRVQRADRQCDSCGNAFCDRHMEYPKVYPDPEGCDPVVFPCCYGCRVCKNISPRKGVRELMTCHCVSQTAIEELEKVGLW